MSILGFFKCEILKYDFQDMSILDLSISQFFY